MITTHSKHPPIPEAGLAGGCERCEEHSMYPFFSLDDQNLALLVERTRQKQDSRSAVENDAMYEVQQVLDAIERLARLDGPCHDDTCPCWEAGFEAAVQNVGEWHRPLGR